METDDFLELVERRLGTDRSVAERAVRATLETLGQRLPGDEAEHLAAQLPPPLARHLHLTAAQDEEFAVEELYDRVAELGDTTADEAGDQVRAVVGVLDDAVSPGELTDIMLRLPGDYADLLAEAAS